MDRQGFTYRYRLSGAAPTVVDLPFDDVALALGDMLCWDGAGVQHARPGSQRLVGVAIAPPDDGRVEAVVDGDAVYAVDDAAAREAGARLDLSGDPGRHGVGPAEQEDLEVVVDCSDNEETLVRIRIERHHEIVVALPEPARDKDAGLGTRRGLTHEAESRLVMAAAAGDPAAVEQLVETYLPAISGVARHYRATTLERAELLQEGVVGLLRALQRFDTSLGTPFWAYALWWVRQAMQHLVAHSTGPAALSDRALRGMATVKKARQEFAQAHRRRPTIGELIEATGLTRDQIDSLEAIERTPRGIEEPVSHDGEAATWGDLLPDPEAESEYEQVLERMEIQHVRGLSDVLSDRERAIIDQHYGLDRPARTLQEIGADLGISAERVRQVEGQALERLRNAAGAS